MITRPDVVTLKSSVNKYSDETHFVRIRREAKEIGQRTGERCFLLKTLVMIVEELLFMRTSKKANLRPTSFSIV